MYLAGGLVNGPETDDLDSNSAKYRQRSSPKTDAPKWVMTCENGNADLCICLIDNTILAIASDNSTYWQVHANFVVASREGPICRWNRHRGIAYGR